MNARGVSNRRGLVVLLVLLAGLAGLWMQSERLVDWFKLRGYEPSAEIAEIVAQTTMTPAARHLFYINRPVLADKADFRRHCPEYEATIVIGCYRQGQNGIHVLKVDDPRLEGVEQVTAAHEMLHAAYDRLGRSERRQVESWLQDYARNGLSDTRIKETLESYLETEPGQQTNEMYAIFGTEIGSLPAELERHYGRFFADRSAVVRYAANYQEAFTSRQQQVAAFDKQLNELNNRIKANTTDLEQRRRELEGQEASLRGYQQAGDVGRYNAGVDAYNRQVNAYNQLLEQTRSLIEQHNQLVAERNAVAAQTVELRQAIDSSDLPDSQ